MHRFSRVVISQRKNKNNHDAKAMFRSFVADCDIHGVRNIVKPHYSFIQKFSWLLIFLASTFGFITFASLRLRYYFSYPYISITRVEEGPHPIPALALCAIRLSYTVHHLPVSMWTGDILSDQEAIELAWLQYGINISYIDNMTGELILNKDAMQMLLTYGNNITNNVDTTIITDPELVSYSEINAVLQRLKRVDVNFRVKLKTENFYANYGLKLENMLYCIRIQDYVVTDWDCKRHVHRKFTELGSCIIYDPHVGNYSDNEKHFDATSIRQSWGDYIKFGINTTVIKNSSWLLIGMLYNPMGYPSWNLQSIHFSIFNEIAPTAIYVEKFVTTETLGAPYRDIACVPETEAQCRQKCWTEESNCSYINFMDDFGYKSPCRLDQQMWWRPPGIKLPETLKKCSKKCSTRCKHEEYKIRESLFSDQRHSNQLELNLVPSTSLTHNVVKEVPLYTYDSLLSEVGGTLGLFIGASLLSLAQVVQFVLTVCYNRIFRTNDISRIVKAME